MRNGKEVKFLLNQMMTWIIWLFVITTLINGICTYSGYKKTYSRTLRNNMQTILVQLKSLLTEYESLPWLIDYWQTNNNDMELQGDNPERSVIVYKMLLDHNIESIDKVTSQEADSLTSEEQRAFAEACYLEIMPEFGIIKGCFGFRDITCSVVQNDTSLFPLFQGQVDGELSHGGHFCPLGEEWPFDINKQPALKTIYENKQDKVYFESRISNAYNDKCLFAHMPVIMDNKVICHITLIQGINEIDESIIDNVGVIEIVNIGLLCLCGFVLLYVLRRKILIPLTSIAKVIREYGEIKNTKEIVNKLLSVETDNELSILADDCCDMIIGIEKYAFESQKMEVEKERIITELNLAAKIQNDMIPNDFSVFADNEKIDLFASMRAAKSVGGDFYDFFFLDEDHMYVAIADVSGKGIPAAMFMMLTKNILANNARMGKSPSKILEDSNKTIFKQNKELMFLTAWIGILEISTGKLITANAGHEKPAVMTPGGEFKLLDDIHGYVLGVRKGKKYEEEVIELERGSKIFVYTDGVVEAINTKKEQFGTDGMLEALNRVKESTPEKILQEVSSSVDAFAKHEEQFDDLTMLCLEYK